MTDQCTNNFATQAATTDNISHFDNEHELDNNSRYDIINHTLRQIKIITSGRSINRVRKRKRS